ncbi:MAG: transcriptional regulator [Terracidiphilus sp.]
MSCSRIGFRFARGRRVLTWTSTLLFIFSASRLSVTQSAWPSIGPDGGDARAFAAVPGQPEHLYLGTVDSWIYESFDKGLTWSRLAKLDASDDLVLDNLVVDSSDKATLFVAGWKIGQSGGGLWISHDAGKSWNEAAGLHEQAIFSLTQAPSDPRMIFAGTLEGVYRSADSGATWTLISPSGSKEIHEVESLAVDPTNAEIIYAGTWHLPWKTTDGGKNWKSIKQGVIEDSDVFSIIIDSAKSSTVFLSACSGIYKSENGGGIFRKVAGIPTDARRTRVLMQDPHDHEIVYAGTTQGLYKTVDGGKSFTAMTGPEVIVNDVFVDPNDTDRVLLATDRAGVLASKDAGQHFSASNQGFSERKVGALLVDRTSPARLFAGVLNDKTYGGVFVSTNGGEGWEQIGAGLEGRDVFALAQAPGGTVVAGTNHGIFALMEHPDDGGGPRWEPRNTIANVLNKPVMHVYLGKHINVMKLVKAPLISLESKANALDVSGDVWLASTGIGLLTSKDQGASWQGGPVSGSVGYLAVCTFGSTMVAARADGVVVSRDAGADWMPMSVPLALTRIHQVAFSSDGTLWLGAREGVYFTKDLGKKWMWIERLPFRDVDDLSYDAELGRVLVSSHGSDQIYAIDPKTLTWKWWQTGYKIGLARAAGNRILAASLFDGVVVEPLAVAIKTGQK